MEGWEIKTDIVEKAAVTESKRASMARCNVRVSQLSALTSASQVLRAACGMIFR